MAIAREVVDVSKLTAEANSQGRQVSGLRRKPEFTASALVTRFESRE